MIRILDLTHYNHFGWVACQDQGRVHMKLPQMKLFFIFYFIIGLNIQLVSIMLVSFPPLFRYVKIDLLERSWLLSNTIWLLVIQVHLLSYSLVKFVC